MRRFLLNATTLFAAFALSTACSPPPGGDDAGDVVNPMTDASDHVAPTDAPRDVQDAGNALYGQCTTAAQCGTGGICDTTYPGGLCTRRCTNNNACGTNGVCEMQSGHCLPSCTSGGQECDQFGGACVPLDNTNTVFVCLNTCFTAGATGMPAGFPMCPAAAPCEPYFGACTTMTAMGADDGAPCMLDTDCKGRRCVAEVDSMTGMATGFVGGYCISFGRLPDLTPGTPALQGSCPPGNTPVPFNGIGPGDDAPCFHVCASNTDCRPGYQCDHLMLTNGMNLYSNGICFPVDCNQSGMGCPTGYHCVSQPSDAAVPPGQCEAGGTDGGVPVDVLPVDASVDVTIPLG